MTRFEFYGNLNKYHDTNSLSHMQSPLYGKQNPNAKYYKRIGEPGNYRYFKTKEEYDTYMKNANAAAHEGDRYKESDKRIQRYNAAKQTIANREAEIKAATQREQQRIQKEKEYDDNINTAKSLKHQTEVLKEQKKTKSDYNYGIMKNIQNEMEEDALKWMEKNGRKFYSEFVEEFNKAAKDYGFDAKLIGDGSFIIHPDGDTSLKEADQCYSDIEKYKKNIDDCATKLHNNYDKYDKADLEKQKALYERNIAELECRILDLYQKNDYECKKVFDEILDHMNNDILYEKKLYENVITENKK